jgi:putative membrane protein
MTRDAVARTLAAIVVGAAAVSYVGAQYVRDLTLHHVGTALGIVLLLWAGRRAAISNGGAICLTTFLLLHVFGARWLYSFVPYDTWTRDLFGTSISDAFGFTRNHYDRLVHFAFGTLLVVPVRDLLASRGMRPRWAALLAIDLVLSTSALYEVIEWGIAVVADPVHAERYNGQQGDFFDAQKDIALAGLGALVSSAVWAVLRRRSPASS